MLQDTGYLNLNQLHYIPILIKPLVTKENLILR